jgi:hypothetical protein
MDSVRDTKYLLLYGQIFDPRKGSKPGANGRSANLILAVSIYLWCGRRLNQAVSVLVYICMENVLYIVNHFRTSV